MSLNGHNQLSRAASGESNGNIYSAYIYVRYFCIFLVTFMLK